MKKSIELLKTKLEEKVKGIIKSIYIGDPVYIPDSCLPCIVINPMSTEVTVADSARDMHSHSIDISIVIDARQYFNATPDKMVGTEFLMKTMEGELSSGDIDPNSVVGVLRDNLTLASNRSIANISSVDYTTRKRTDELITLETSAHIEIQYIVNR